MVSVEEEILNAKSIGITGHIRPDGDCVGSTLGLYNYIRENMGMKINDHSFLLAPFWILCYTGQKR